MLLPSIETVSVAKLIFVLALFMDSLLNKSGMFTSTTSVIILVLILPRTIGMITFFILCTTLPSPNLNLV